MKLVYYPDEILSKAATPIDVENPQVDLVQLKEDMLDVMIKSRGLGLSACQVGLPWKVFVMGETKEAAIMVVNPEIIAYIQVIDQSITNNDEVYVFNGWMFSSSPSINPFDHPVYDVWLTGCY